MKRKFLAVAAALVIGATACGLAACGGDEGEPIDPNKTQITVAIKNDSVEKKILANIKTVFEEKNKDLQIVVKPTIGANYAQSIFNFSTTEFPDLLWSGGDTHHAVSAAGKFENLQPYFERDFPNWETEFASTSMRAARLSEDSEEIWFAPRDFNQLVVLFNKDIFENARKYDSTIKLPTDPSYYENGRNGWTWAEFEETMQKLRALIVDDSATGIGLTRTSYPLVGLLNWNPVYYTLVKGFGGEILNGTEVKIDDPATRVALEKIRSLTSDKLSTNNSSAFTNKLAAMQFSVRTSFAAAKASNLNVDAAPFPIMPTHVVGAGCSGYAMSASSEHKEGAWRLLSFMLSEEGQEIISRTQAIVPVRTSLYEKEDAAWRTSAEGVNNDAFVANLDKVLHLNFADGVPPANQGGVYEETNDFFYSLVDARYAGDSGLDSLISIYVTKLQNAVAGVS